MTGEQGGAREVREKRHARETGGREEEEERRGYGPPKTLLARSYLLKRKGTTETPTFPGAAHINRYRKKTKRKKKKGKKQHITPAVDSQAARLPISAVHNHAFFFLFFF